MSDYRSFSKYFSESKFWKKIGKIFEKVGSKLVYSSLLLYYTMLDENVSFENKALIIGALGYLIFPLDLIADIIPVMGYTDDMAALIFVINQVKSNITPEIQKKSRLKLKELIGEFDENDLKGII